VPIVVGGLGQPEDGNLVAQGMGHAGAAAPGEMAAVITATATLTATASTSSEQPGPEPEPEPTRRGGYVHAGHRKPKPKPVPVRKPVYAEMSAVLPGWADVTATAVTSSRRPQVDEELLLLVGAF
jgi:hypothetical protein